jgi:RimJ/RimL family protein N-acetyltransferase
VEIEKLMTPIDPLLLDIADSFDSERLTIRVPRAGDGPGVNAAVVESLDTLRPWMPWAQTAPTQAESEANCRKARGQFILRQDITLRLYLRGTDTVVGSSGLHRIDWSVPKFEIGYWISLPFQRKGFATEAVQAIARFAFDQLNAKRLEICVNGANAASRGVAEKCGFELEAIRKNDERDSAGALADMLVLTRFA